MSTFDLTGPLPSTTTLLEASAGTGKTYAIAALAARFIAEQDLRINQLLLITFGHHAAGELQARVLARLQDVLAELDSDTAPTDPIAAHLASGDVDAARTRLRAAIDGFNEATIVTTHSFCQTMLRDLGILGDWDPDETVGPDPIDLVQQCAADTYLVRYLDDPAPAIAPARALQIAREACIRPLPLVPAGSPQAEFCEEVRRAYAERKATTGICTFNDITVRLRDLLRDPDVGATVVTQLQKAYPVVMVDEFQDTDPEQWDIVESAFVAADRTTVLIGDPKQSIYGFRGADLGSYLKAHQGAQVFTLDCNYRSDPSAVEAVIELFGDLRLGSDSVRVTPVRSYRSEEQLRLPARPGLWLRRLDPADPTQSRCPDQLIEDDLAEQIWLLRQHAQLPSDGGYRPVGPDDIAVLVRTSKRARQLRSRLSELGIPTVLTGSQSVWSQPASLHWETLLRAIAEPTQANIRVAALSELIGSPLEELFADTGHESSRVSVLIRSLAHHMSSGGVLDILDRLRAEGLEARLLEDEDGPRTLADLAQLAELLDNLGATNPEQLLAHLRLARHNDQFEQSIQLATDDPAVRIMTIHAAKGLEFPIVLLPETGGIRARRTQPFTIVEQGRRCLYVGPPPDWRDALTQALTQQHRDEELRLLYVAMTRAKHLTLAWQATERGAPAGPLTALLAQHGQPANGQFRPLNLAKSTVFDVVNPPIPNSRSSRSTPRNDLLHVASWTGTVDQTWRRTSYSGLTQGLHDTPAAVISDEVAEVDLATPPEGESYVAAIPSPMATLPAGPAFGTLVHAILEQLIWEPDQLHDSAQSVVSELASQYGLDSAATAELMQAIILAVTTPLKPITTSSLSDLPISRRLPELDFDLPLADRGSPATVNDLAALLAEHLPLTDPFTDYPDRLASSEAAAATLNGFLTGSIDAVLQLDDESFLVVDYKTNRLGGTAPTLGHYTADALAEAMMQAHYPLQAILYSAALHRFLRLRLPGYDPKRHLGGVGYLFLRGMAGPTVPIIDGVACGVMSWRPSSELVTAVSDLLGGHHG